MFITFIFSALPPPRIHSWGDSLEEAFEQCAMGMFGYMTDTETVEPLDTVDVESEGESEHSLTKINLFFIPVSVMLLPHHWN